MPTNRLPPQPTSFIGREKELAEIARLLDNPNCRLLTLTGVGGIGKTRAAIQAATDQKTRFADGIAFVSLAPVVSHDLLASAIAGALAISFFGSEEPRVQLMSYLREKQMLLVMDNFEHLLDGVGLVSELLQAAPGLKILVTSRERLNIQEEWAFALDGLTYPLQSSIGSPENYSAVQLFMQRARQVQAHFAFDQNTQAAESICRKLEGMPLGLELAASWLRVMSCQQIEAQIPSNLDFLTTPLRNIPERHRSLRAVFTQSWSLLSETEQNVLMKLSVFRGGFDLEAAEQIAGASLLLLASLADKSLVRVNDSGRYDLHELLRQYAAERLSQAQEFDETAWLHLNYFTRFADKAESYLFSANQTVWFDKLEIEQNNLRTALAFALNGEAGLHLAASLGWFFGERPYWNEGLSWLERALAANPKAIVSLRAKASHNAAALAGHLGDKERLDAYCQQAIFLAETIHDDWNVAWALCHLGFFSVFHSGYDANQLALHLEKSVAIFRRLDDQMGLAHSLIRLAWNALDRQDINYARRSVEEAESLANKVDDTIMIAWANKTLGNIAQDSGNLWQARIHLEKSLERFRQAKLPEACNMIVIDLADVELQSENIERAEELYKESIKLHRTSLLNHPPIPDILAKMAYSAQIHGQFERSARLLGAANQLGIGQTATLIPDINGFERSVAAVRAQMGSTAFDEAWARGQAMTLEQAITYVLEDSHLPSESSFPEHAIDQPFIERELEILRLMADGLNSREIAQRLILSVGTIRWYLKAIYSKLDVHSRSEAIARAKELKLLM